MRKVNVANKTVLIVDDDAEVCEAISMAITMEGHQPRTAQNCQEGLEIVSVDRPSIIFLDYYGVGDDADQFISYVRENFQATPIVLMTGAKDPESKTQKLGLKHFLRKPFNLQELLKLMDIYHIQPRSKARERVSFSLFA